MQQSLSLVSVLVRDYDEALAFYVGTLGFRRVEDRPVPEQSKRWLVVEPPGGAGCRLLLARASSEAQQARIGDQTGGRVFLFLHTDDIVRDHARYAAAGVDFVRPPRHEPYGTVAVFRDLYGNLWDLIQPAVAAGVAPDDLSGVQAGYDRWAAVYDHDANPLVALEEPVLRAAVGDPVGLRVLDLGTGTGRHALWLAGRGAEVTALDFSEGMLRQARARPNAERVRFLQHDLHAPLPFADGSFDCVVSGLVLEHLATLDLFFAEAHRVLRPGGRAVVSAMHPAMVLRGSQARFTDPESGALVLPGSKAHSVGAFVMAALQAGFRVQDLAERAPDERFARAVPRAARYVGWPMLVLLVLEA